MSVQGFVYFIRGGELVKIGYSTNPRLRLSQLQTASAERLRMVCAMPGTREDEHALHVQFATLRVRGEWFRACPGLLAAAPWICARALDRADEASASEAQRWVDAMRGCLAVLDSAADDLVEAQTQQVKRGLADQVRALLDSAVAFALADPEDRDRIARQMRTDAVFSLLPSFSSDRPDVPGANGSSDETEALS